MYVRVVVAVVVVVVVVACVCVCTSELVVKVVSKICLHIHIPCHVLLIGFLKHMYSIIENNRTNITSVIVIAAPLEIMI